MYAACQRISMFQMEFMCIEFLTAQVDYNSFIAMMLEYKAVSSWQDS